MRLVPFLSVLLVSHGVAEAQPVRSGFTIGLDAGLGVTAVSADGYQPSAGVGLAGLDLQLGGFVSPRLAISARVSGTQFRSADDQDLTYFHGLLGVVGQYWVSSRFFVGGGAGLAVFGIGSSSADSTGDGERMPDSIGGVGLEGRAGYEIWRGRKSALQIAVELIPATYDGGRVTSTALQLGWQHY
jgi:hypothetical protein